jgi:hypothetical protein
MKLSDVLSCVERAWLARVLGGALGVSHEQARKDSEVRGLDGKTYPARRATEEPEAQRDGVGQYERPSV